MINSEDPYEYSINESISETPQIQSSNRNRKIQNKKSSKDDQQRIVTRSSQKSSLISINNKNESSSFSQFINPKKRQYEEKKTKILKRPKNENQPPNDDIQAIEQVKLIYETADGRTNLARAAVTNARILTNRIKTNPNTTYNINIIDDTQTDTLVIPDTIANLDTQHNDSSWQRDIDRLMKKLEQTSSSNKSQTQIQETQFEEEPITLPIYPSQTNKTHSQSIQTTTIIEKNEIGIQTETSLNSSSSIHNCCQDISTCPCVLRYSKLEHLFMEKISQFINIVPTIPNSTIINENHSKHRSIKNYSRFRRFRGYKRIHHKINKPSKDNNNQSTIIEEISNETTTTTDIDNQAEEILQHSSENNHIISTTITIEKPNQLINDLSSIEKIPPTTTIDHSSTLLISSNNSYSTDRSFILTTSSLDENQKIQFRLFLNRFNISSSTMVDSSTTHVIVNENSSLVCPLTGKIIQGIARHLFIVSYRWINECLNENLIIDERPFEIRGDTSLGIDHGGMRRSRLTSSYLLEKYSICLKCSSNDCAPLQTIEQIQELIQLSGGKLVQNFSEINTNDNQREMILILGLNSFSDSKKKKKLILDTCQQFHVKCLNIHWLLISIAKYEIQPFENYLI